MGLQIPRQPPKGMSGGTAPGAVVRLTPDRAGGAPPPSEPRFRLSRTQRAWAVGLCCAVAFLAWDSLLFLPVRLLVVTFHELGHAAVAVLTGGEVIALGVGVDESGVTVTRGANRFYVLNGGYLGSILTGVALLVASPSASYARGAAGVLGTVLAAVAVRYFVVDPVGLSVVLFSAVCLMGLATRSPGWLVEVVVRTLGWFSLLYSAFDIRNDVFRAGGPDVRSDAAALEALTGVAAPVWGVAWLVIGMALLWTVRRQLR